MKSINENYQHDFTEIEYARLLRLAKANWRPIGYPEYNTKEPSILWRHDIDYSAHRARALAKIEASQGIRSTYFILLHGAYYNPLETEIADIIKAILSMGHSLGLHFDPSFYGDRISKQSVLTEMLDFEKTILERIFGTSIEVFSWHNPTVGGALSITDEKIAGMINAYGVTIKDKYSYVSDSNGIWRYRHLKDVLEDVSEPHLQVLIHPEWWVPEYMLPRDRIVRAINGRARAALINYDAFLESCSRPNVGSVGLKPEEQK